MEKKIKEPVRMRLKELSNGNRSIYLDIYMNGKRSYEFLKLYLVPERTREDRERNRETIRIANSVKASRVIDIQNGRYDFISPNRKVRLFDYFSKVMGNYDGSTGTIRSWKACYGHLLGYEADRNICVGDVDKAWAEGFITYLRKEKGLSNNTTAIYVSKIRCVFNKAVRDGIIGRSPFMTVANIKMDDIEKSYLTVDELRRMAATPAPDRVKRPFLFACLTGLRFSDVQALDWSDVVTQGDYVRIVFRQRKTRGQMYLDLNPQAVGLMGERPSAGGRVFDLYSHSFGGKMLRRWAVDAGVAKHISFHSGRHTFAVMMLELTGDLYMVSKLLGHADISTTQIYAKILDKNRQKAVSMIPNILK